MGFIEVALVLVGLFNVVVWSSKAHSHPRDMSLRAMEQF